MYGIAERFRHVASRWDLRGLHDAVAEALGDLEAAPQPQVPTHLVRALDMYLDAYGEPPETQMNAVVNFAFVASEPERHPPPLAVEHVEQLVQYMEGLAQVSVDQAEEPGFERRGVQGDPASPRRCWVPAASPSVGGQAQESRPVSSPHGSVTGGYGSGPTLLGTMWRWPGFKPPSAEGSPLLSTDGVTRWASPCLRGR